MRIAPLIVGRDAPCGFGVSRRLFHRPNGATRYLNGRQRALQTGSGI